MTAATPVFIQQQQSGYKNPYPSPLERRRKR